ncbi:glutamate 5-kinase [Aggregatilinea lenta]|uniref:glutamate 5-kinase n=1 Tax=Aggregatilinea lenta TaxID=913108 RepID=UPI000E5ABB79|nr:glutamate 5-kinase [Aggregatilinea lenta]
MGINGREATVVVKLGTSTLTGGTSRLSRPHMVEIVRQVATLRKEGCRIVVVSSGAMAAGRELLGYPQLPNHLPAKQMLSAVGQGYLIEVYRLLFRLYDVEIGQVLLTHADLSHRTRYLNARDTLNTLLDYGIVPIVNENDTVAVEEIKVGDNDNLSAQIAGLLHSDQLIMLTDQDGLYDHDPRTDPRATLIAEVHTIDEDLMALAGVSVSGLGVGGMVTKIQAARLATRAGTRTVIANGRTPDALLRIVHGEALGTAFVPPQEHVEGRKRWLLAERPQGQVVVDEGASEMIRLRGASLLPVGIRSIAHDFERGAVVMIEDSEGHALAHGLVNYSSAELQRLRGHRSQDIVEILGYTYGDEAIHRDNMVLV